MLCSNCNAPIKPVVAVDIDGTLGDYHGHFLRFAAMYTGNDIVDTYRGKPGFKQWFLEHMKYEDERSWHDIKLAYRQGGQKRFMPVYQDAARLCRRIRDVGAELWLTTTRPYLRLDNIDPDTRFWLSRHGIEYDHLISREDDKYEVLAEHVDPERVVAVIDDLPEMFEQAARIFGWQVPLLRKTQYNSAIPCEQGHRDLNTLASAIRLRINEWKEQHESNRAGSTRT